MPSLKWLKKMRAYPPETLMSEIIDVSNHRAWKPTYLNRTVDLTIRRAFLYEEKYKEGSELGLKGLKLADYAYDKLVNLK